MWKPHGEPFQVSTGGLAEASVTRARRSDCPPEASKHRPYTVVGFSAELVALPEEKRSQ